MVSRWINSDQSGPKRTGIERSIPEHASVRHGENLCELFNVLLETICLGGPTRTKCGYPTCQADCPGWQLASASVWRPVTGGRQPACTASAFVASKPPAVGPRPRRNSPAGNAPKLPWPAARDPSLLHEHGVFRSAATSPNATNPFVVRPERKSTSRR